MKNNSAPDFISDEEMSKLDSSSNAPDFISDSDMEKFELAAQPKLDNPIETALKTSVDELSTGYYPQIAAGIKTMGGTSGDYAETRDKERRALLRGQFDNETASKIGTGVGLAGALAIPIGGEVKGLGAAMKAGKASAAVAIGKEAIKGVAIGSAFSALKNPGDVEGQVAPIQLDERMKNLTEDLPLNIGMGVAGGAIGGVLAKSGENAAENVVKALKPTPTKASTLIQDDAKRAKDVGEYIFKKGIVKAGDDASAIYAKAKTNLREAGNRLSNFIREKTEQMSSGKVLSDVTGNPSFDPQIHFQELQDGLSDSLVRKGRSGSSDVAAKVVDQAMQDYQSLKTSSTRGVSKAQEAALNLDGLNQMKRFMQDQVVNYDALRDTTKDAGALSDAYNEAAQYFGKKVEEEIARFGDGPTGKALKNLNREYSLASDADLLASKFRVKDFTSGGNVAGSGIGAGLGFASVYGITKNPSASALAAGVGAFAGSKIPAMSETTKAALANSLKNNLRFNPAPKASLFNSVMDQTFIESPPPLTPEQIDVQIKRSQDMTPSQKAKARNEVRKGL